MTDRLMAYGMIGSAEQRSGHVSDVIPITLEIIDTSSISIEDLIAFREREASERNGRDYTKLRHAYADLVQEQIKVLSGALDQTERERLSDEFRQRMEADLAELRRELGAKRRQLFVTPIVVAAVATGGALLTGMTHELQTAAAFGLTAAAGSKIEDVAKTVAGFVKDRMGFNDTQREILAKHPMAYMWELSKRH